MNRLFAASRGGGLARLLFAIALSSALAALSSVLLSSEPEAALSAFFLSPFASARSLLSMLELASPLALCAVGVLLSFRAGHYALGGEGQVYAGALGAALFATSPLARYLPGWLGAVRDTVAGCPCEAGCPSCVQSPQCGNGNHPLDKTGAITVLNLVVDALRTAPAESVGA